MGEQVIRDEGAGRYYHVMLNMDDDELDPFEYRLLGHYRRACGARNVPCIESTRTTAQICRMSVGKVSQTRQALVAGGWIELQEDGNRLIVTLVDRMRENVARYAACSGDERSAEKPADNSQNVHQVNDAPAPTPENRSPGEQNVHHMNESFTTRTKRSPGERHRSPDEQERSPGERKKEQLKKEPSKKEPITSSSSADLDQDNARAHEAAADDDEGVVFVRSEAEKMGLGEEWRAALLALPLDQAVGLLVHARRRAASSPAGLLITLLRQQQPPPEDALALAPLALALRTVEPEALERERRRQAWPDAAAGAPLGAENAPSAPSDDAQGADNGQAMDEAAGDGLDEKPGRGTLTIGDLWQAELGQLRLQLSAGTFDMWLAGCQPRRYADGMLVVRTGHRYGAEWLTKRLKEEVERALSAMSGAPIRVKFEAPSGGGERGAR